MNYRYICKKTRQHDNNTTTRQHDNTTTQKIMKKIFTLLPCFALIFSLNAQTFTNYTTTDGLLNNTVNALDIDSNDQLWFGTQSGVSHFDGTTWTNYTEADGLIDETVLAISVMSNGAVWVGTDFGLSVFDGISWTSYTEADGLADNRVKYIEEDAAGNVWIGNNDGVSVFDGSNWISYTTADGLPFGGVSYVTIHPNGDKWLGTGLGGVVIFDGTSFTEITENEGLLNDKVRSIAIDEDDNKWVGTSDGISVFDTNNQFVTNHEIIFILPPPDELNPVEDVKIDSKGNVWAGVYVDYLVTEGGVSMYNGNNWIDYDVADGLVGPVVRQLAIDSEDNIWVATSTGISKISDVPTAVSHPNEQTEFSVFPNPTSDFLNVELTKSDAKELKIYSSTLQLVKSISIEAGQTQVSIDVQGLTTGIYFMVINQQALKFVVK